MGRQLGGIVVAVGILCCACGEEQGAAGQVTFLANGSSKTIEGKEGRIWAGYVPEGECPADRRRGTVSCVHRDFNATSGAWICWYGKQVTGATGYMVLEFDAYQHFSDYVSPKAVTINVSEFGDRVVGTFSATLRRSPCQVDVGCPIDTSGELVEITQGAFDVPNLGTSRPDIPCAEL